MEISISDIESIAPLPNRITEILKEKQISPLIESSDLELMHLSSMEQWYRLLRGQEQLYFMDIPERGIRENMFAVAIWLGVELCDLHGICMGIDGNGKQDCKGCKGQERWAHVVGQKAVSASRQIEGQQILGQINLEEE